MNNPEDVANAFNIFFQSVGECNLKQNPTPLNSHFWPTPVSSMILAPASEIEVARVIHDLPSKKSDDINGMSMWTVKQIYLPILIPLTKLINLSLQSGTFPSALKISKVIPIY